MNNIYFIVLQVFLVSLIGTKILIDRLAKSNVVDIPNERSNHNVPIPRGGGIAIIISIILGVFAAGLLHYDIILILSCTVVLSIISFIDDRKNLPIIIRLIFQILAVIVTIGLLPQYQLVFHGFVPFYLDRILAGICLLWFINCYNFMDGIDGIAASQTIHIALSIVILSFYIYVPQDHKILSLIIIAASLGFLIWNWHKAKIFMGDVGSVPLGLIMGFLLLRMSANGYLILALVIPSYYIFDSGFTILKRLLEGKKIWQAHSEHFYQQAVRTGGLTHSQVVIRVIMANVALVFTCIATVELSVFSSLFAIIILILLIRSFNIKKI